MANPNLFYKTVRCAVTPGDKYHEAVDFYEMMGDFLPAAGYMVAQLPPRERKFAESRAISQALGQLTQEDGLRACEPLWEAFVWLGQKKGSAILHPDHVLREPLSALIPPNHAARIASQLGDFKESESPNTYTIGQELCLEPGQRSFTRAFLLTLTGDKEAAVALSQATLMAVGVEEKDLALYGAERLIRAGQLGVADLSGGEAAGAVHGMAIGLQNENDWDRLEILQSICHRNLFGRPRLMAQASQTLLGCIFDASEAAQQAAIDAGKWDFNNEPGNLGN